LAESEYHPKKALQNLTLMIQTVLLLQFKITKFVHKKTQKQTNSVPIFDYYKSISDYRSSDSYFDPFLC